MSGFFETLASPLVNTPDSMDEVVDAALGEVMKTGGRPAATTATATTSATSEAQATDARAHRFEEVISNQRRESRQGNNRHTRFVKRNWGIADVVSGMRLLLIPALWAAALLGWGGLIGLGFVVAGF